MVSITNETNNRLGLLIKNKTDIDWIKISMFSSENKYEHFPALYLRFKKADAETEINRIRKALEGFKGQNEWLIEKYPVSKKDLYSITIKEFHEYNKISFNNSNVYIAPSEYFGKELYDSLCKSLIEDISRLCDWLEENL